MPDAVILVRNTVTHDARVLREARTLESLGYRVVIVGVTSGAAGEREGTVDGHAVIRLSPLGALRRLRPRLGTAPPARAGAGNPAGSAAPAPVPAAPVPPAAPAAPVPAAAPAAPDPVIAQTSPAPGRALAATAKRLIITGTYYAQGIRLVRAMRPELIHANDYNTMWIGLAGKLLCRSRLVYDAHELWADRNGRQEWRPALLAGEAIFVRGADATITASPGYAEAIARRYRVRPPEVIRNIPEQELPEPPPAAGSIDGALGVYVGGLMEGRGLEEAIAALPAAPDIRLRLIGPGRPAYRARLEALAEAAGVRDRVQFVPAVAPSAVVAELRGAGFGLLMIQPICRSYELTLPNKLFEYAAAGLPMLTTDLPVIGSVVREAALGVVVAPGDVAATAAAMTRLADESFNRALRGRVETFAAGNRWEDERERLRQTYRRAAPHVAGHESG